MNYETKLFWENREPEAMQALHDVMAERRRQVMEEGWSAKHDDEHGDGAMAIAAACYALVDHKAVHVATVSIRKLWEWTGWASQWFKPKDKRRNLVRATALLLAEMERLDRAAGKAGVAPSQAPTIALPAQLDAEVYVTRTELIVVGSPDKNDESHNCDAMGCTSVSHVLFRFALPAGVKPSRLPREWYEATLSDPTIQRAEDEAGGVLAAGGSVLAAGNPCKLTECQGKPRCDKCVAMGLNVPAGVPAVKPDLPEWVPVDVRMPRHGQRIIGRSASGMWTETHDASEPLGHMTHWMPMERGTSGVTVLDGQTIRAADADGAPR